MSTISRQSVYQPRNEHPIFIPGRRPRRAASAVCRYCLVVRRARSGRAIS
jgi:hypothetical protein